MHGIRLVGLLLVVFFSMLRNDQVVSQMNAEKCSILEAVTANAAGWRKGDFLMKEEISFDTFQQKDGKVTGVVMQHLIIRRVAFDLDEKQFTVLTLDEKNVTDFDAAEAKPVSSKSLYGWALDKNRKVTSYANGRRSTRVLDRVSDDLLKELGYCDLRGFWFRGLMAVEEYGRVKKFLKPKIRGIGFISRGVKQNKESLVFEHFSDPKVATMTETFSFDQATLAVQSRKISGKLANGKPCKGFSGNIEWKTMDDLQVPIKANFSDYAKVEIDGRLRSGGVDRAYEIHWIELNRKLDTDLFNGKSLTDSESLLRYLSPKIAKKKKASSRF